MNTVNVEIFAPYIFSRISCRALDVHKFNVRATLNHNRTNKINQYVRKICYHTKMHAKARCAEI